MMWKKGGVSGLVLCLCMSMAALAATDLNEAAYEGDMPQVNALLAGKFDPDRRDRSGGTALHAAMFQKNTEIIIVLLKHGFDVNAQGRFNGYTPLHDAVWADNPEAVKILLEQGADMTIPAKDGLTAYDKAKKEGKDRIVAVMDAFRTPTAGYDATARRRFSENDAKAFIHQWFAGFDHQNDAAFFKKRLSPDKLDMAYPGFPIRNIADFERWYADVIRTIRWNAHHVTNVNVSGNEQKGFSVSLDVRWQAKTYDGKTYDMNIRQDIHILVDAQRNFLIDKLTAETKN